MDLDFYDALREVNGTERRIKFKDGRWHRPLYSAECIKFVHNTPNSVGYWMPDTESRREKAWSVEPAPEELVDFKEAFAAALDRKEIAPEDSEFYSHLVQKTAYGAVFVSAQKEWWPTPEQRKGKWRVKPEEVEEEDVFVWGVCDQDDGSSKVFAVSPNCSGGVWHDPDNVSDKMSADFEERNLFPKDKPQKYKLVKVDD
jgi:hypothetical protein